MVDRYAAPMQQLVAALPGILPPESRLAMESDIGQWSAQGFPPELARTFAGLPYLTYALDIIDVALERRLAVADVGLVYFALSDALHSKWLMDNVEKPPVEGR